MSRLMGIDYGEKRVGVALSDEAGQMAFPLTVFPNDKNLLKNISTVIVEKKVTEIVIGHSLDKAGAPNKIHDKVEAFMLDLTLETGLPIHLEPELYTTQAALRLQGRNDQTDAAAASLILDNYLVKNKKK
ncbi:MAG TPA: Holliday junction resolvase RuvX [Candidatus Paceibacterota bacterium]|nr:Holliday junction resolvase RuvX [Candidatus Paceibacterota bacterium]HMO82552.1 Holliday junction resolvase RuvX [Candidatus Paceibacterota bacterium]